MATATMQVKRTVVLELTEDEATALSEVTETHKAYAYMPEITNWLKTVLREFKGE